MSSSISVQSSPPQCPIENIKNNKQQQNLVLPKNQKIYFSKTIITEHNSNHQNSSHNISNQKRQMDTLDLPSNTETLDGSTNNTCPNDFLDTQEPNGSDFNLIKLCDEVELLSPKRIYSEPLSYASKKGLFEKVGFSGTKCSASKMILSSNELEAFYLLKNDCEKEILKESNKYDEHLYTIWRNLKGDFLNEQDFFNDKWVDLGFQSNNPRTDFRAGGLLALKQLVYHSTMFKTNALEMCKPENQMFYALTSINVSHYLMKYYHFCDDWKIKQENKKLASRKAFKSFCQACKRDSNAMNIIHSMLLNEVFEIWKVLRTNNSKLTYFDFSKALAIVQYKFKKATKKVLLGTVIEIEESFKAVPTYKACKKEVKCFQPLFKQLKL